MSIIYIYLRSEHDTQETAKFPHVDAFQHERVLVRRALRRSRFTIVRGGEREHIPENFGVVLKFATGDLKEPLPDLHEAH